uniref:Transcription factor HBP-1a n=1 Tax=Anthurium amnicola TaxID=1678845 RepID=A0A1D1XR61_9ARAE
MITGKNNNEMSKTSGASANGVFSQSDESSSEGSSEGSDANSQNDSGPTAGGGQGPFEAGASQNGSVTCGSQNGVARTPSQGTTQPMSMVPMAPAATSGGVVGPTTNLNIGMEYWGVPSPSQIAPVRGKVPNASIGGLVPSGQNIPSELWLQDERELKRQRRKQSNRESARRSRLRKQAEYEELALRADSLKEENAVLRAEAIRLRKEYEQLLAQNNSLKEKLGDVPKGTGDSRLDRNEQHFSADDQRGRSDSDAQAMQKDPVQSGH